MKRLGQALEPPNCVLDASWSRLEEFSKRLEAIQVRRGEFGGRSAGAKAASSLVWGGVPSVFATFYAIIGNL